ncbi:hypothetical protein DPMN_017352 [Dreissena polymorpha]|uniref:Uncharacterized protein n=1 Tax=Dreissena polymorpha TaxID=45954 RepID=A0A9D4NGH8_DREPO|nr:hypothetical protein DPMN_017352 [Dreissena polymorpha]
MMTHRTDKRQQPAAVGTRSWLVARTPCTHWDRLSRSLVRRRRLLRRKWGFSRRSTERTWMN